MPNSRKKTETIDKNNLLKDYIIRTEPIQIHSSRLDELLKKYGILNQ